MCHLCATLSYQMHIRLSPVPCTAAEVEVELAIDD